jgi:hypothetical protein
MSMESSELAMREDEGRLRPVYVREKVRSGEVGLYRLFHELVEKPTFGEVKPTGRMFGARDAQHPF